LSLRRIFCGLNIVSFVSTNLLKPSLQPIRVMAIKLRRFKRNPILAPRGDDWEALAVFNCGAIRLGDKIHILYRAVGDYVRYASSLGHAILDTSLNVLERSSRPVLTPSLRLWELSIEDPRITMIDGEIYVTYVTTITPAPPWPIRRKLGLPKPQQAYSRCAVASTQDFKEFRRLGPITPYDAEERNLVLFPERFGGRYAALHRPINWVGAGYPTDRPGIWFSWLDSIPGVMYDHRLLMKPEQDWEYRKIGAGPPPIKTDKGWLLIYHGVDENEVYRAGAALLDLREPWKVVARLPEPILEPEEDYEKVGDVPNVVFPEGAVLVEDELIVFYGAADKYCCAASINIGDLLDEMLR